MSHIYYGELAPSLAESAVNWASWERAILSQCSGVSSSRNSHLKPILLKALDGSLSSPQARHLVPNEELQLDANLSPFQRIAPPWQYLISSFSDTLHKSNLLWTPRHQLDQTRMKRFLKSKGTGALILLAEDGVSIRQLGRQDGICNKSELVLLEVSLFYQKHVLKCILTFQMLMLFVSFSPSREMTMSYLKGWIWQDTRGIFYIKE